MNHYTEQDVQLHFNAKKILVVCCVPVEQDIENFKII